MKSTLKVIKVRRDTSEARSNTIEGIVKKKKVSKRKWKEKGLNENKISRALVKCGTTASNQICGY